jgi:hypothetical protein
MLQVGHEITHEASKRSVDGMTAVLDLVIRIVLVVEGSERL